MGLNEYNIRLWAQGQGVIMESAIPIDTSIGTMLDGKMEMLWCSKMLEGESFMDIAVSEREEGGHVVHGWENKTLLEKEAALENKSIAQSFYFLIEKSD